jgi:hypothetical protein
MASAQDSRQATAPTLLVGFGHFRPAIEGKI